VNPVLAASANVPKLGGKELLPLSRLARYRVESWRTGALGLANGRPGVRVPFGKITKRGCRQATLNKKAFVIVCAQLLMFSRFKKC